MNVMRRALCGAAAAILLAILAGCVPQREAAAPRHHPDLIIVREFAFTPHVVTLDPSFGFSLYRGAPGVPPRQRADSVGRAAAFNLADRVVQLLSSFGYDVVSSDSVAPEPGGRALIVSGTFRRIYEGHRRQGASVAVAVEIDYQSAGALPQRLTAFDLDSRRLLRREALTGVSARHGNDVNNAAAQVGATVARYVDDLARLNRWPKAAR
jgi:hypothetical protein